MRIGAHVSASGGISNAIGRGLEIGCETIQIFGSSPQSWAFKPIPDAEVEAFRQQARDSALGPVFLHAIYLINMGTADKAILARGIESLANYMTLAADIGAEGVIFHPGSHKGAGYNAIFEQVVESINRVLDLSPEGPCLCLENMAGMGQHIGAKFGELGEIINAVDCPRLRICLDTQHSFAAGHDLTSREGVNDMMIEFAEAIGLDRLAAVHANDSRQPRGSGVDRHENIGEGLIGEAGFEAVMGHPAFRQVPFFLEVPGFAGKGPDQRNIDILKGIRRRVGIDD